jgi:hypothetical protein
MGGSGQAGQSLFEIEGAHAVARLAALGTYLANLRDDSIRARYTELSETVRKAMSEAARTQPAELDKLFGPAERIFAELNADCVKMALDRPM